MRLGDIKRVQEIVTTLVKGGFSYYVHSSKLNKLTSLPCRIKCYYFKKCVCPVTKHSLPFQFREILEDLGPTFIKLGQLLSVRPDFIPYEYTEELRKLQDKARAAPFKDIKETIEKELGKSLHKLFSHFDKTPIASASIGQVHRAILKNGKKVAVKVQHCDIDKIEQDLRVLKWIAEYLEEHWEEAKKWRPQLFVSEFADWTKQELDFRHEGRVMEEIKENFKGNKHIAIPSVFWDHTTEKVLTMDFLEGANVYDDDKLKKMHINRHKAAINGTNIMLQQTMVDGTFHADPHPGNIIVMKNEVIGFVDFGIIGRTSPHHRRKMLLVLMHLVNKDFHKATDHIIEIAETTYTSDVEGFRRQLNKVFGSWYGSTLAQDSLSRALFKGISLGAKYEVYFPSDLVLFVKALFTMESTGRILHPRFDLTTHARPFIEKIVKEDMSLTKSLKELISNSLEYREVIENIPIHLSQFLKRFQDPEQRLKLNFDDLRGIKREYYKATNIKALGTIIAALVLSSAVVLFAEGRSVIAGYSLGTIQIALAGFLSIILIVLMLRKEAKI